MSENLKTIKELADELGISKKYLQNKISYEKKKQKLSIGNWKKISGKNTIVLSQKEQALIKSWLDEADSLGNKQEDKEKSYLKERIFVLEKFLDKEQTSNSELKKIIQQTQNLLDQQQRLALQDKKLLEEYKAENDNLKALKMPSQETEFKHLDNQYKDEVNALKEKLENLQEQIKDQKRIEEQEKPRKWWGLWRK
ncbi:hypothetical protein MGA447_2753 [Enterococcus faecalis]|uniref:hypothetical protein n=1 Tax=Enterococcus faecalis TaxID=1351 RepID=UPI000A191449|nr:hypothetical protein [Enterococcus faecalis]OSH16149.1 hypothetical protein MGA447_2753 [Enterococcus faecalis]